MTMEQSTAHRRKVDPKEPEEAAATVESNIGHDTMIENEKQCCRTMISGTVQDTPL